MPFSSSQVITNSCATNRYHARSARTVHIYNIPYSFPCQLIIHDRDAMTRWCCKLLSCVIVSFGFICFSGNSRTVPVSPMLMASDSGTASKPWTSKEEDRATGGRDDAFRRGTGGDSNPKLSNSLSSLLHSLSWEAAECLLWRKPEIEPADLERFVASARTMSRLPWTVT